MPTPAPSVGTTSGKTSVSAHNGRAKGRSAQRLVDTKALDTLLMSDVLPRIVDPTTGDVEPVVPLIADRSVHALARSAALQRNLRSHRKPTAATVAATAASAASRKQGVDAAAALPSSEALVDNPRATPYEVTGSNAPVAFARRFPFHTSLQPLKTQLGALPPLPTMLGDLMRKEARERDATQQQESDARAEVFACVCRARAAMVPAEMAEREAARQVRVLQKRLEALQGEEADARAHKSKEMGDMIRAIRRCEARLRGDIVAFEAFLAQQAAERAAFAADVEVQYEQHAHTVEQRLMRSIVAAFRCFEEETRNVVVEASERRERMRLEVRCKAEALDLSLALDKFRDTWIYTRSRELLTSVKAFVVDQEDAERAARSAIRRDMLADRSHVKARILIPQAMAELEATEAHDRAQLARATQRSLWWAHLVVLDERERAHREQLVLDCATAGQRLSASKADPFAAAAATVAAALAEFAGFAATAHIAACCEQAALSVAVPTNTPSPKRDRPTLPQTSASPVERAAAAEAAASSAAQAAMWAAAITPLEALHRRGIETAANDELAEALRDVSVLVRHVSSRAGFQEAAMGVLLASPMRVASSSGPMFAQSASMLNMHRDTSQRRAGAAAGADEGASAKPVSPVAFNSDGLLSDDDDVDVQAVETFTLSQLFPPRALERTMAPPSDASLPVLQLVRAAAAALTVACPALDTLCGCCSPSDDGASEEAQRPASSAAEPTGDGARSAATSGVTALSLLASIDLHGLPSLRFAALAASSADVAEDSDTAAAGAAVATPVHSSSNAAASVPSTPLAPLGSRHASRRSQLRNRPAGARVRVGAAATPLAARRMRRAPGLAAVLEACGDLSPFGGIDSVIDALAPTTPSFSRAMDDRQRDAETPLNPGDGGSTADGDGCGAQLVSLWDDAARGAIAKDTAASPVPSTADSARCRTVSRGDRTHRSGTRGSNRPPTSQRPTSIEDSTLLATDL